MKQQPHRAYERMKSKQKQNQVISHSNWPHVFLFNLAYKQCSGIFEVWLCCLSSESKRRFLVNDILIINVWLSMMFGHGANPVFFDKRIKDWTSRTLVNPTHPLHPVTSSGNILHPFTLLKVDVICVSPLTVNSFLLLYYIYFGISLERSVFWLGSFFILGQNQLGRVYAPAI